MWSLLILCFTLFYNGLSLELPSYITPCKKSDPNLNECAFNSAKSAIKDVINGDKKHKVLSINPLRLPVLVADLGPNLQLTYIDLFANGFQDIELKSVKVDLDKMEMVYQFYLPLLHVVSKYTISGSILVLPIEGEGDLEFNFINGTYDHKFSWKLKSSNNQEFMEIEKYKLDLDFKLVKFRLDNLFGDKTLSDNMNNVLNDNWADVIKEIGPGIGRTIGGVINSMMKGYFESTPYNEIFLE